jgi:hypothetical protein
MHPRSSRSSCIFALDIPAVTYRSSASAKPRSMTMTDMEALRLPAEFNEAARNTALDIDAFLTQDERPEAA